MTMPSQVRVGGPLADYKRGFWEELAGRGYTPLSITRQLGMMAHLSRWLADQGWGASGLSGGRVDEFVQARRQEGYARGLSGRGLAPLLEYLRAVGAIPAAVGAALTPIDDFLAIYRRYLLDERGLATKTVDEYVREARGFLAVCSTGEGVGQGLGGLCGGQVSEFVMDECARRRVGSAKCLVTSLRSFLRFSHVEGWTAEGLASAVPSVASWRGSSLPRGLDRHVVAGLLRSCDRRKGIGRRDVAGRTVWTWAGRFG